MLLLRVLYVTICCSRIFNTFRRPTFGSRSSGKQL